MDTPSPKPDLSAREWLTVEDAATHFQTTPKTIRKWLYERRLRYYKIGGLVRINIKDLKQFPVLVPTANEVLNNREK